MNDSLADVSAPTRSLDSQREEFTRRRLIATPIAGMTAWSFVAIGSLFLEPFALSKSAIANRIGKWKN